MDAPPAWSLLLTGVVTGIAIGVFACFLLYLSGNVPPLQPQQAAAQTAPPPVAAAAAVETVEPEEVTEQPVESPGLELEFYQTLPEYEVLVDATPVPVESPPAPVPMAASETVPTVAGAASARPPASEPTGSAHLLQIGAFQQLSSAERQIAMLANLGVNAVIKNEVINGRTLHLVQAGPFAGDNELNSIRAFLKNNDINSFPLVQR